MEMLSNLVTAHDDEDGSPSAAKSLERVRSLAEKAIKLEKAEAKVNAGVPGKRQRRFAMIYAGKARNIR